MVRFPSLEYNLSHPHPKGQLFLLATLIIFLLAVPALVLINVATLGSELVPTLQSRFQPNETLLERWWGHRLPALLRPRTPRCEPKDLGRGDEFRVSNSLFDYKVMSAWNTTENVDILSVREQKRFEYRGESFADCFVNNTRFDWSVAEQAQTMTVGVVCPGNPSYPVYLSMETTMTFAWLLTKDFIGQYYGPGLDLLTLNDTVSSDYRKMVFAVLELIAQDSLTIMRGAGLIPIQSASLYQYINPQTAEHIDVAHTLAYVNGTSGQFEADFPYGDSINNLVSVVVDAVNLDLGSSTYRGNIFRNASALPLAIYPNTAPDGISPANWAKGSQSFYYGNLSSQYGTWAEGLLDGWPVKLDNPTGLRNESVMVTTYLCPMYQTKPIRSLLASVFVGSATMTLSLWGVWKLITTFLAKRIMPPVVHCSCANCVEKNGIMPQTMGPASPGLDDSKSAARNSGFVEMRGSYYPQLPP